MKIDEKVPAAAGSKQTRLRMRHAVEISADLAKAVMEKAAGRTAGESWHLTDADGGELPEAV